MKIVEQTAERLVFAEKPALVWFVGLLFVAGGILLFRSNERVFGSVFAAAGAGIVLGFANSVTVSFDRTLGRFTQSVKGPVRRTQRAHALADIARVGVEASASGRPSRAHRVVLTLMSGVRVPLSPAFSSGRAGQEQTAAAIRTFLNLPDTPSVEVPGFGEMFKMLLDPDRAVEHLAGKYSGSIAAFEDLVRREPHNVDARRQLATALALQNRTAEARQHFEAARDLATRAGNGPLARDIDVVLARLKDSGSG